MSTFASQNHSSRPARLALLERWRALRAEHPALDTYRLAARLDVTEADIAAALCAGGEAVALRCNAPALIDAFGHLGPVRAITGNAHARVESFGSYREARFSEDGVGLVSGPGVDLRLLAPTWRCAFALEDRTGVGKRRSIVVYGEDGSAVHTVILVPESDVVHYRRLVAAFGTPALGDVVDPIAAPCDLDLPEVWVDVVKFRAALRAMRDWGEFARLLRAFGLRREQGLRLAGEDVAAPGAADAHAMLALELHRAERSATFLVASRGAVQRVSGRVPTPLAIDGWTCMLDTTYCVQIATGAIARTWIVRKRGAAATVTSIESYDRAGTLVLQTAGERHAGHSGSLRGLDRV